MRDFGDPQDEKLQRFQRIRADKARRNSEQHEHNKKHKKLKGGYRRIDDPKSDQHFDWKKYI